MTENIRTVSYIVAAVVLLVVAGIVNRKPTIETENAIVDRVLFPEIKSPSDVNGLEIVTLDPSDNQPKVFKVVRDEHGWSLPSHGNYPADAEKQVASAAASLIDLKVLGLVSNSTNEHATYGVLAPDPEKAPPGGEGVGKLVTVLDKSGKSLARLVIGKEDKRPTEETGGQELRFVRVLSQDAVYRVALPSAKFTTNFADWIETDLLKLDPWDITQVRLKDYTVDIGQDPKTGGLVPLYQQTSTIKLDFNDKDAKWTLNEMSKFEKGQPKPVELAVDEEVNTARLNEMKTALDDLKIVDVRSKPAGISGNLKANKEVFTDNEALRSLIGHGFFPGSGEGDESEILSSDGDVLVRMKDGLEYTLRFGRAAGVGAEDQTDSTAAKNDKLGNSKDKSHDTKSDDDKGTTLNRYIMVSARFNPDLVPKPDIQPVPDGGAAEKSGDKKDSEGTPEAKDATSEKQPAPDTSKDFGKQKTETASPSTKESAKSKAGDDKSSAIEPQAALHFVKLQDDAAAGNSKSNGTSTNETAKSGQANAQGAKTEATKSAATKSAVTKQPTTGQAAAAAKSGAANETDSKLKKAATADKGEPAKADKSTTDAKGRDADTAKATDTNEADTTKAGEKGADKKLTPEAQEDLALERKRIENENERKQKEYDDKIKNGEKKARDLNDRFADWYYVVSEATYRKIHLNRDDVIKKKEEKKDTTSANGGDEAGGGLKTDALKIPPLKADPFQKRDETKESGTEKDE